MVLQLKPEEYRLLLAKKAAKRRRNKYGAIRTEVADGTIYDSKAEATYCEQLKLRRRAGEIESLELQPRFPLRVNDVIVGEYVADAMYVDVRTGKTHVIDVKGGEATRTQLYRLKKKLMLAIYNIEIEEVG